MRLLIVGILMAVCGCGIDQAQFELRQSFHEQTKLFVEVGRAYAGTADEMAQKKHSLQQQLLDRIMEQEILKATDPTTGMVQFAPESLRLLLEQRDEAMAIKAKSERVWTEIAQSWRSALDRYLGVSAEVSAKDAAAQEAKAKLRAVMTDLVKTLGGLALGAGAALGA